MNLPSPDNCYRALLARDRRFDGVFFVGVSSTRIYCRPICGVRSPRRQNCRFFPSAAAAEAAGHRPCLRCRPELAPGRAATEAVEQLAHAAMARLPELALDDAGSLEGLAREFGVTSRHLRRSVAALYGASPVQLLQTHRLLLARRLLRETAWSVTEISGAAGFRSLRRFNALYRERYRVTPSRSRSVTPAGRVEATTIHFALAYRPPLAWMEMLGYLARRAVPGVEVIDGDVYARTVRIGIRTGWIRVRPDPSVPALNLEVSPSLVPVLALVLARARQAFDLDARPDLIEARLAGDPRLALLVKQRPGLRVPGGFDPFELAVRTVVGQQVSVTAASTVMGSLEAAFGEPVETPIPGLNRLPLTAARLALLEVADLATRGLNRGRALAVIHLARAVEGGEVRFDAVSDVSAAQGTVQRVPGIGPWTASYLGLRVWRWPDAFPSGDLGLRQALGGVSAAVAESWSQVWRPWRGYAALHLWHSLPVRPI